MLSAARGRVNRVSLEGGEPKGDQRALCEGHGSILAPATTNEYFWVWCAAIKKRQRDCSFSPLMLGSRVSFIGAGAPPVSNSPRPVAGRFSIAQ